MSVTGQIRRKIAEIPEGVPFSVKELLSVGLRSAIDQALSRAVRGGLITRVARGVFVKPKQNRFLGNVLPEPAAVAKAVASASGCVLEIHGAEAARRFGFTTQVPSQPIYYTSGPNRRFRMGQLQVVLKHVSPQRLSLAGRPAGEALSALRYLGKRQVTPKVISAIRNRLGPEEFEALESARAAMPGWLATAIHNRNRGDHG